MSGAGDIYIISLAALAGAALNGGLGYGFSSVTVPVGLLFRTGRVLNPALVLLELVINAAALVANRRALLLVLPRVRLLLLGAAPGVALGGAVLAFADPGWLKVATFAALLPLLALQLAGVRRPVSDEHRVALPAGALLGLLYGATTISGPALALVFNNQGLSRDEFRAALSLFRIAESSCTALVYLALGLFAPASLRLSAQLVPAVLLGFPLGWLLLRRLPAESFRRAAMATDLVLVAFGLVRALT
jgi:uncharacterized membrane protein YfcA